MRGRRSDSGRRRVGGRDGMRGHVRGGDGLRDRPAIAARVELGVQEPAARRLQDAAEAVPRDPVNGSPRRARRGAAQRSPSRRPAYSPTWSRAPERAPRNTRSPGRRSAGASGTDIAQRTSGVGGPES